MDGESVYNFCSLDVCNLYGSIPLEDINPNTPSVFTVAKRFFNKYKNDCELWALSDDDFDTLVRLCLASDTTTRVYKKNLNRFEIALNFAKPLLVSSF